MNIDYKRITESLISGMLSDWRGANRDAEYEPHQSEHIKRKIAVRLAALTLYEDMPMSEILRLVDTYNETHYYLSELIDRDEVERYINECIQSQG